MGERNDQKYLEEHHQITETALGLISLELKECNYGKAAKTLDNCKYELDKITVKYQPATALMQDLQST